MGRTAQLNDTQTGLIYLAKQTGGFPVINSNDLAGGIKRVMDDQRGYYLVGYRPDESTFDPKTGRRRFHQFSLKVKRPGLTVRTRKGFYGVPEETLEATATALTRGQQLRLHPAVEHVVDRLMDEQRHTEALEARTEEAPHLGRARRAVPLVLQITT